MGYNNSISFVKDFKTVYLKVAAYKLQVNPQQL